MESSLIEQLKESVRLLTNISDLQCGPPLKQHEHYWKDTMEEIEIFLKHFKITEGEFKIKLKDLVDAVWNEATESEEVPSTKIAYKLINKVFNI